MRPVLRNPLRLRSQPRPGSRRLRSDLLLRPMGGGLEPCLHAVQPGCIRRDGADPNDDVSMRIIADHARAATFVISDGQYPGNDKRGYVLRKIMRRAIVHGKKLKIEGPFLYRGSGTVIGIMKDAYPELAGNRETIARAIKQEEDSFADTLEQGLKDFDDRVRK